LTLATTSGAVCFGAVSWLAGDAGGKPFLDWAGPARWLLVAALAFLWLVLAAGWYRRWRAGEDRPGLPRLARGLLLAALAAVPPLLAWASGPGVYPAINPDSGGATGGSLLGSSLAVVAMMWAFPWLVGRPPRRGAGAAARRVSDQTLAVLVLHLALFALLDHGDHSHHEAWQIAALASLAVWPPLLVRHLRRFEWPPPLRPWLAAFAAWGALLVASACVTFLPGVLERWKFTDALVAHAHLAMAALATSFLVPILATLGDGDGDGDGGNPLARLLARRLPFALWHGGCLVYVVAMTAAGQLEGGEPALLYTTPPALQALYAARWLAGAAMLAASLAWLRGALRELAGPQPLRRAGRPATASAASGEAAA
jgi:cytochrome c oxidase cbb3-type subunit 1